MSISISFKSEAPAGYVDSRLDYRLSIVAANRPIVVVIVAAFDRLAIVGIVVLALFLANCLHRTGSRKETPKRSL